MSWIHFGKVETAQQSCRHHHVTNYVLHTSCIFTEYFSELLSASSSHKYYEIPRACVISVYQALPPVFQTSGKEASSTTTETSTSLITIPPNSHKENQPVGTLSAQTDYYCHSEPTLKFKTAHIWFTGSALWLCNR